MILKHPQPKIFMLLSLLTSITFVYLFLMENGDSIQGLFGMNTFVYILFIGVITILIELGTLFLLNHLWFKYGLVKNLKKTIKKIENADKSKLSEKELREVVRGLYINEFTDRFNSVDSFDKDTLIAELIKFKEQNAKI